jgi:hypothetical protein
MPTLLLVSQHVSGGHDYNHRMRSRHIVAILWAILWLLRIPTVEKGR